MDELFCVRFPDVFQGKGRMTPLELTRMRAPTIKEDASIFRKKFIVDDHHQLVENKEPQPNSVGRHFNSFTLPNWSMPFRNPELHGTYEQHKMAERDEQ